MMPALRPDRHRYPGAELARRPLLALRHTGLREDDAFLAHYPKSGGTWLRMMLTEALASSEVGFETAASKVPPVGKHRNTPGILPSGGRLIKTHESYRRSYGRAILLVRDVRDVLVSYFHYWRLRTDPTVTLDQFVDRFVQGSLDGYQPWHLHNGSWLDARDSRKEILVIRYEDLRAEPITPLGECLGFLGADFVADQLPAIIQHNTMTAMRDKEKRERHHFDKVVGGESSVGFVRQGSIGGWHDVLEPRHLHQLAPTEATLLRLGYPNLGQGL